VAGFLGTIIFGIIRDDQVISDEYALLEVREEFLLIMS